MRNLHPRTLARLPVAAAAVLALALAACGEETDDHVPSLACEEPAPPPCADNAFQDLDLKTGVAPGLVTSSAEGDSWVSVVDATAGGAFSITDAYVYARFTDAGLEKVLIDDDQAFESMEWDIAFRRFVIRINSGDSGPSCVAAVRMPGGTTFDALDAPPASAPWMADDYYTAQCDFIPDSYGLGSPETVLSGFWTYPGCVQMTGNVYVLRLRDDRRVKLTVEAYYYPQVQAECQENDATQTSPTGSANITVRWAFLD